MKILFSITKWVYSGFKWTSWINFHDLNQIRQNVKLQILVFWMEIKWYSVVWNALILITKPWKYLVFISHIIKNIELDKNFSEHLVKIKNILKLWRMRQLTLEWRITVLNFIAVSKVILLSLITKLHNDVIDLFYEIHKNFIWQQKNGKS